MKNNGNRHSLYMNALVLFHPNTKHPCQMLNARNGVIELNLGKRDNPNLNKGVNKETRPPNYIQNISA